MLLHFLSLMLGSVLVLMLPLLVWLTPDLRIKKSLLKCNWTIRKRLPRCKMRLKKRLLAFSRRLHFFFQAEDGIRDADVTGVQTCALPISKAIFPKTNYNGPTTSPFMEKLLLAALSKNHILLGTHNQSSIVTGSHWIYHSTLTQMLDRKSVV